MRFGRRATWGACGLGLGLICSGLAMLAVPPAASLPPDFMGHAVAGTSPDPVLTGGPTFEIRRNCRIGRFGVAPWLPPGQPKDAQWERMTRHWLASIGMPREGHNGAIARLRGVPDAETAVGNLDGPFDTSYRVGNRYVSCLDSQTRFRSDDQTEIADSYRYSWAGIDYPLVIIRKCGNVTRLPKPLPYLPSLATPEMPQPAPGMGPGQPQGGYWAPPVIIGPPPGPGASPWPPGGIAHEIPEPGSIWLALAAMAAIVWVRRRK